jgi:hypothetical protein
MNVTTDTSTSTDERGTKSLWGRVVTYPGA